MIDKVGYYSLQSISTSFVLSNFEVIITLCSSTVVFCNKPHPTLYDGAYHILFGRCEQYAIDSMVYLERRLINGIFDWKLQL